MEISNKTWIWILIAVIVFALLCVVWQYGFLDQFITKEEPMLSGDDTTADIDNDLNTVDVGNPDQDLKNLDADLNQL